MTWKRLYCLFGKHKPAKPIELKPLDRNIWDRKLVFCERCRKILYIGYFPLKHPNCLCTIQELPENMSVKRSRK